MNANGSVAPTADTVLGFVFMLFFVVLLIVAVVCIVRPSLAMQARDRLGLSKNLGSGGWFYSTPWLTRCTGAVLLVIAVLGLGHVRS